LVFGFAKYNFGTTADVVLKYILPIAVIIIASEFVRNILLSQEDRFIGFLSYLSAVAAEVIIHYTLSDIFSFKRFMDIMAMVFLPAILSNLLYHYLSKRYGFLPNIAFRLIYTLHPYIVLYETGIPDSLLAFINLLLPLAIYLFIDYLYEKKRKYALAQHSPLGVALTVTLVAMMTCLIMLVSNVFQFGAYVIATESLTGELNKGDIAIYERYDEGEVVEVGDVIVFKESNKYVVHRVADKSNINGETRYYTKGDANSEMDLGYITDGDIKGVVVLNLPFFGYPTLWLRDLFK
jgi:signal peptidase I